MENKDVNKGKQLSEKLIKKAPNKIPIILKKDPKSKMKAIEKTKYLIPKDFTVSQFSLIIRKRIELNQKDAFFLIVKGKYAIAGETRLNDIYEQYANEDDGILYVVYAEEEFGG